MEYVLYHSGKKGMKWGLRLYQNKDGSLTPLGRIHYAQQKRQRAKNLAKARTAKVEKRKREEEEKTAREKMEAEKSEVLAKGSATDILKYKGKLTNQEMQTAVNRLNLERQLSELSAKEVAAGKQKTEDIVNKAIGTGRKVAELAETGTRLYNSINNVRKALDGDSDKKPKITSLKIEDVSKLSDKELGDVLKRATSEKSVKKLLEELENQ